MTGLFRLATFNLENLDWSPGGEAMFKRRAAVLTPILDELRADIICLQEIDAQKTPDHGGRRLLVLDRLFTGGLYETYYRATSVRPGTNAPADVHNLAILSRWPISEQRQLFHDIVAKWSWTPPAEGSYPQGPIVIAWDRPLLYARIAAPDGASIHIINLHLRAPRAVPLQSATNPTVGSASRAFVEGQFLAAQKREGQALEARLFVERLFDADANARIAVCGDLNSQEYDAPARILRGGRDEETAETSPRLLSALSDRVEEGRRYTVVHAGRPIMLDHIFASPSLAAKCLGVDILNAELQDEVTAHEPILGSLHAPIVASFDFGGD
jgi:endonuclease/exonuclease/phosphatase family metal-dependent hydrolase